MLDKLVGAVRFELTTTGTPCRYATRLRYAPSEELYHRLQSLILLLPHLETRRMVEFMQSGVESDEVRALMNEVRNLKNTARALRDALEQAQIDRERSVQEAVREAHNEITQLKATAGALRDGLEQARIDHDKAVQAALAFRRVAADHFAQNGWDRFARRGAHHARCHDHRGA